MSVSHPCKGSAERVRGGEHHIVVAACHGSQDAGPFAAMILRNLDAAGCARATRRGSARGATWPLCLNATSFWRRVYHVLISQVKAQGRPCHRRQQNIAGSGSMQAVRTPATHLIYPVLLNTSRSHDKDRRASRTASLPATRVLLCAISFCQRELVLHA